MYLSIIDWRDPCFHLPVWQFRNPNYFCAIALVTFRYVLYNNNCNFRNPHYNPDLSFPLGMRLQRRKFCDQSGLREQLALKRMGVERVDIGRVGALLLPASGIPLKERSPYSSVANNTVLTTRGSGSDITMERERSLVPWRQRRKCPGPVGAPEAQPSHSAGRYHRGISPGTRSWNMITRCRRGLGARQSGDTISRQVRVCGVVLQRFNKLSSGL